MEVNPEATYKKLWISNASITSITIKPEEHLKINFIGSVTHFADIDVDLHI